MNKVIVFCMNKLEYNIEKTVCVNFTLPFWLDKIFFIKDPKNRKNIFMNLAREMNLNSNKEVQLCDYADIRTLEKRKNSYIQIKLSDITSLEEKVKNIFQDNFSKCEIECNYIDYGAGFINIKIYCNLFNNIDDFFLKAEKMKSVITTSIVQYTKNYDSKSLFDVFDDTFYELKNNIVKYNSNSIEIYDNYFYPGNLKHWMCGPVARDIIFFDLDDSLQLTNTGAGKIKKVISENPNNFTINLKNFKEKINFFLGGIKFSDEMETGYLPYIYHSFEGTVAIVNPNKFERLYILQRMAMFYWTVFYAAASGTYIKTNLYFGKDDIISDADLRIEIKKLEDSRRLLEILKFESKPENIIVEGIDGSIYSLLFDAYESDKLDKSLVDMERTLDQNLDNLLYEIESIKEQKMQNVLSIITVATISGTVMDMYLFNDQFHDFQIVFSIIFLPIIIFGILIYFYVYKK